MSRWKLVLATAFALALAGLLAALAVIYSGVYNVAASRPHYALEKWLFKTVREHSVAARADEIEVPANLDGLAPLDNGLLLYEEHCAVCHLRPGMAPTPLHRGVNPKPPKLTMRSGAPARQFWIIKHGIRSTGMPAWGRSLDDAEIWSLVAFQRRLLTLSANEYEALLDEARQEKTRRGTAGQ